MKILADECLDRQIVERLRQEGHAVNYVAEMSPGVSDDDVLRDANHAGALLVTADKDFGELVFRLHRANAGVLLVRLSGLEAEAKAELVANAVRDHEAELSGVFSVLSTSSLRIRRRSE